MLLLLAAMFLLPEFAHAATLHYVYDGLGRLIAEIDPVGETTIYSYDAAGNILSVSRGSSSQLRVISSVPSRGKSGDTITVYGSGFIADPAQNSVSFNGAAASATLATTTSLIVTVPPEATTGPIAVSNANGSAVSAQAFIVLFPAVITAVNPATVSRGVTTRITIYGSKLSTATAVSFDQEGIEARIPVGQVSDTELAVDLTVAGPVPFGSYAFSITNDGGPSASGSVSVSVTAALLGDAAAGTAPVSVHLPAVIPGAPAGNAMSVTAVPVSVHSPAVIPGAPPGNAMSVTAVPVSVHLPAVIPGAPPGNAMSVTQPVSVSTP